MAAWCVTCRDLHSLPINDISCMRRRQGQYGLPDFYRASGDIVCDECGLEYRKHPDVMEYLSFMGQPYLKRLCSGDLVKL